MKRLYLTLLILFCVTLAGCMFRGKSRVEQLNEKTSSEQEMSDKIMEDIAKALDAGDADALKSLYAEPAIEATPDLDEQIKELIDYYQGTMKRYKGDASSSTAHKSGKKSTEFKGQYQLITTEVTYQIFYNHKPIDDFNPEEIGLYRLEFATEEEYSAGVEADGYYSWKHHDRETGAYY